MDSSFKRFPDGRYYRVLDDHPDVRMCSGLGGTCDVSLSPTWHDPLCPGCRFVVNARLALDAAEREAQG